MECRSTSVWLIFSFEVRSHQAKEAAQGGKNNNASENRSQSFGQILFFLIIVVMADSVFEDFNIDLVQMFFRNSNRGITLKDKRQSFCNKSSTFANKPASSCSLYK
jgi:hypothetical protein